MLEEKDRSTPITISVPRWMRDYLKETPGLKASWIFQEAIIAKKKELEVAEKLLETAFIYP